MAYRCPDPSCGRSYLEVGDLRWDPCLLELGPGILDELSSAPLDVVELAFRRLRRVDHRTVSLVGFEQTLLGAYDPTRLARIVYPDGSES